MSGVMVHRIPIPVRNVPVGERIIAIRKSVESDLNAIGNA